MGGLGLGLGLADDPPVGSIGVGPGGTLHSVPGGPSQRQGAPTLVCRVVHARGWDAILRKCDVAARGALVHPLWDPGE